MQAQTGDKSRVSSERPLALAAPNGCPDSHGELTVERLRLLVKTISYDAARRAFDAEETLIEGRAGSEESERRTIYDREKMAELSALLTLSDRFRRKAA
ncbi:MAG: hypothetical protein E5V86_14790 [Mesorhizobium sp.]|nr:MAG: hypothetical protein E5V86_14790 [Mesorhizobium sp.]